MDIKKYMIKHIPKAIGILFVAGLVLAFLIFVAKLNDKVNTLSEKLENFASTTVSVQGFEFFFGGVDEKSGLTRFDPVLIDSIERINKVLQAKQGAPTP